MVIATGVNRFFCKAGHLVDSTNQVPDWKNKLKGKSWIFFKNYQLMLVCDLYLRLVCTESVIAWDIIFGTFYIIKAFVSLLPILSYSNSVKYVNKIPIF